MTRDAIGATLDVIGGFAAARSWRTWAPAELRDGAGQEVADYFMPRATASAEPWLTFLTPVEAAEVLATRSMVVIDDVDREHQIARRLWQRSDQLHPHKLGRLVHATLPPGTPRSAAARSGA